MYTYKDVYEFQKKHPSREEREQILRTLPEDEIKHLASTCGNITTAACFMQFARQARSQNEEN